MSKATDELKSEIAELRQLVAIARATKKPSPHGWKLEVTEYNMRGKIKTVILTPLPKP